MYNRLSRRSRDRPAKTIKGVYRQWKATDDGSREAVKDSFGFCLWAVYEEIGHIIREKTNSWINKQIKKPSKDIM